MCCRGEEWTALGLAALVGALWVLRDPGFVRLWGALFWRNANEAAPAILVSILGLIIPAFLFRRPRSPGMPPQSQSQS